jgi:hypothetical protein
MTIIAIDPGPTHSAVVVYSTTARKIAEQAKYSNEYIAEHLQVELCFYMPDRLVIEQVCSYGMPVGAEVFETVYWSGIFAASFGLDRTDRIPRKTIVTNLCGSARAKDANVRQAIIDRFGGKEKAIGNKKQPGPLYGIGGDCWSALAVALTWCDQQRAKGAAA